MGRADGEEDDDFARLRVCRTANRDFSKEYIAQMNERTLDEVFPGVAPGDFLLVRNTITVPEEYRSTDVDDPRSTSAPIEAPDTMMTELHTPVLLSEEIPDVGDGEGDYIGNIGLDFTVRTALGAPSELEVRYGEGVQSEAIVEARPMENPEDSRSNRLLNRGLGVRPQVCRVRMGVFPDLEDKVCRLPKNTIDILGIEDGENVTIESTRGERRIVRGVKAFEIDDERKSTKQQQKDRDSQRYPSCAELLGLRSIRRTEVDIPEIWIDEEVRTHLGLDDLYKSGVCQPVRVYRDAQYLLGQMLHQFAIPLVLVLVAAGLNLLDARWRLAVGLWGAAILVWIVVLGVESHSRLS